MESTEQASLSETSLDDSVTAVAPTAAAAGLPTAIGAATRQAHSAEVVLDEQATAESSNTAVGLTCRIGWFLFWLALSFSCILAAYGRLLIVPAAPSLFWSLWAIAGACAMLGCSRELAWFCVWFTSLRKRYPPANQPLTIEDAALLTQQRYRVAVLIPAHQEAQSAEAANCFRARLQEIAEATVFGSHCECTLFALLDTDERNPENAAPIEEERRILSELQQQLSERLEGAPRPIAVACEYRSKPPELKTKPGSHWLWLQEYGDDFDAILVLDADSSFAAVDPSQPATLNVLDRMALALLKQPDVAAVQTSLAVAGATSQLGWIQSVEFSLISNYFNPLITHVFGKHSPNYGHGVLFRRSDYQRCYGTGIPLKYLSHDYIEAAVISMQRRSNLRLDTVITTERPEDSVQGYLMRDQRWARGNAQWFRFLATQRDLPWGAKLVLVLGIFSYLLPIFALCHLIGYCWLRGSGTELYSTAHLSEGLVLMSVMLGGLIIPRWIAARSSQYVPPVPTAAFAGYVLWGVILAWPIVFWSAWFFATSCLSGGRWVTRASRQAATGRQRFLQILRWGLPPSLLGCGLLWLTSGNLYVNIFDAILISTIGFLIISPMTMLLVSLPIRKEQAAS